MKKNDKALEPKEWTSNDYSKIEAMESFNRFVRKKNTYLFSVTAGFLIFYILLPILAFRPVLQQKVFGNITGVWIYSGALFIMTLVLATIYIRKATKFDKQAEDVIKEYVSRGEDK